MKRPKNFTCQLGGVMWRVYFVRRGHPQVDGAWGTCHWDEREIYVRYDQTERRFIDTLLHELRHALSPCDYCAEEWITTTSTEIAMAMMAAGVRMPE